MQGRRAGLVTRVTADAVDLLVVSGALLLGYGAFAAARFVLPPAEFRWPQPHGGLLVALGSALLVAYLAIGWSASGRTIGKQVMGVRVVGHRGEPLGFGIALARAAACALVPLGLLWCAVSRENRSLQDLVLRTSVVYDWRRGPSRDGRSRARSQGVRVSPP